jgi:catechol-2,3-dioxygenase
MKHPSTLWRVVLQTNQLLAMRDWYCRVLSAHPALDDGKMAFLAFDHEHHRVGIFHLHDYEERKRQTIGIQHMSFTYDSVQDLMDIYLDLKCDGILPIWTVHHGPTVSMYYADPDGNQVEP